MEKIVTHRAPSRSRTSLPFWLPEPVAEFVRSCELGQTWLEQTIWENEELRARLLRLTTRDEMRDVWRRLSEADFHSTVSQEPDVRAQEVILRGYLLAAVYPGQPPSYWESHPTEAQQRETLRRIAEHANDLWEALGGLDPSPASKQYTAWNSLDQGLPWIEQCPPLKPKRQRDPAHLRAQSLREVLVELRALTRGRFWSGPEDTPLHVLTSQALFGPLPKMLHALAELASLVATMPVARPPKKSKTVYRNACVRRLATYVTTYFNQPLNQVIATTVNVALDIDDEGVTEDLVRRIVQTHRKIPGKKGKRSS
ncbi:MAG TPA: hypothetical protein VHE58_02620 [Burkholderiales bacterium]|nr:hypothetical protein [Burkholderiales bacterium]